MRTITIVGPGRLGGAFAIALARSGYTVDNLLSRSGEIAVSLHSLAASGTSFGTASDIDQILSDLVLIATPDPEITVAANDLAEKLQSGTIVLHSSGSQSSEILSDLRKNGCFVGSLHPLLSVSDPVSGAKNFAGAYFCVEGDPEAVEASKELAASLGGQVFTVDSGRKPLYHAAAVMSSGHVVALVDMAMEMLAECHVTGAEPRDILLPLIQSTVENLRASPPEFALTGSFARGDEAAVGRHLDAIVDIVEDDIAQAYLLLAERSLEIAERVGLPAEASEGMRSRISMAKRKREC